MAGPIDLTSNPVFNHAMPLLSDLRSHIPIVHQKAVKAKGRGLARISQKHAARLREYAKLSKRFLLDHPYCQYWLAEHGYDEQGAICRFRCAPGRSYQGLCEHEVHRSTEVHHRKGRGKFLLDTTTWMAVSRYAHLQIHADPKTSYAKFYMLPRN